MGPMGMMSNGPGGPMTSMNGPMGMNGPMMGPGGPMGMGPGNDDYNFICLVFSNDDSRNQFLNISVF